MTFTAPEITWGPLIPLIVVLLAGAVGVLVESFVRTPATRRAAQLILTFGALAVAFSLTLVNWLELEGPGVEVLAHMLSVDRQALLWHSMLLVLGALGIMLFADRTRAGETPFTPLASTSPGSPEEQAARRKGFELTEVYPLALFAVGGMMLFTTVTDLIFLFVALELFSLPLYIMVASARRRRMLSQEAALKYFLLGAFASAVMLFGAALLYGATQSTSYAQMAVAIPVLDSRDAMAVVGVVFVLAGLLFKLGAVPFHSWTPDVYEGAPTPVTAFMGALVKAAAAAALVRVLYSAFFRYIQEFDWLIWTVAIASMLLGSIVALRQSDIKRMLAYSSIGHAGFILVAFAGLPEQAVSAVPFYVFAYGLATIGAFAVVTQVRERGEDGALGAEATRLGQWAGLGRRHPLLAGSMALFMLSFAGIPLTAGFIGKFVVFAAAVSTGAWVLVLVAVIASAIAAFFYVRLIVLMFFTQAPEDVEQAVSVDPSALSRGVIYVTAAATFALGVFPAPLLRVAESAVALVVNRL